MKQEQPRENAYGIVPDETLDVLDWDQVGEEIEYPDPDEYSECDFDREGM